MCFCWFFTSLNSRTNLTETNQGRYDIELKLASQGDASGGNPCQITKLVAIMAWVEGNVKLLPFEEWGGSKGGQGRNMEMRIFMKPLIHTLEFVVRRKQTQVCSAIILNQFKKK
ncbi:hypothetical protein I7I48_08972 [Histoplasma ohiense]|nr:hypothetical protein I7I48_08972 [Histoplasma ohiense (nom. inval.)]